MATKKSAKKSAAKKSAKKSAAKKSTANKSAASKSAQTSAVKKSPARKSEARKSPSISLSKEGKDPRGGLTEKGREYYNEKTGGNLKPGVKGTADTPEKKKRKGSFLTRHFTTPPGPVVKDGKPTRQALQAAAWGEPVPKTPADEKKLAAKGRKLLDEYHADDASSK